MGLVMSTSKAQATQQATAYGMYRAKGPDLCAVRTTDEAPALAGRPFSTDVNALATDGPRHGPGSLRRAHC